MDAAGVTGRRTRISQTVHPIAVAVLCVAVLAGLALWNVPSPRAGEREAARVVLFTFVATGMVFVDPDTSEIVWRNSARDERRIGDNPWRAPKPRPSELTGFPAWRDNRDIVGNPGYDLVAWVETVRGERGDLVVVQASTGDVLARTPVKGPAGNSVVIASVDDDVVYFATPNPVLGWPDVPGVWIWVWNWSEGTKPENLGINRFYNDVSAGTWAVYEGLTRVHFEHENGSAFAVADIPEKDYRTDFGSALSPDGTYWYGARTSQLVETATGSMVRLPVAVDRNYGWTGPAELTLTDPFMVCSAVTGQCRGPAGHSPDGVCALYGLSCGNHLPAN